MTPLWYFEQWWDNIGSGLPPFDDEDHAEHVERIAHMAFMEGVIFMEDDE